MFRRLYLIRRVEETIASIYPTDKVKSPIHLSLGQEAVAVGVCSALRPGDVVFGSYRGHAAYLAKGGNLNSMMAELFGRIDGCAGGKGGSMHMFDKATGFLGGHGIVGGHLPIATGVGFAIKYRGGDQVICCFFGEAAVNNGAFHESLNMAALWKLPVIFIIENNRYGMGTAVERASAINDIVQRAGSYDMHRAVVDGQDVLAVRAALEEAVGRARTEQSPTLLEMRTYRFMGHSMSDAVSGTYRSKAELDEYLKRDPIALLRAHMEERGTLTEQVMQEMDTEIKAIVQDAWDFAEASPEPPLEALMENVYVDTTSDAGNAAGAWG